MPDNRFTAQADVLRNMLIVLDELDRYLSPTELGLSVSAYTSIPQVTLHDFTDDPVNGSLWHKTVMRLTDLFDAPIIVEQDANLRATFTTPFDVEVVVNRRLKPFRAALTMSLAEAVA
jgi:hypothetical protein